MGKISDKFLDAFNLKNEEYDEAYDEEYDGEYEEGYEEEAYDEYDEYDDEPKQKEGGLFGKKKDQHAGEEKQSVFSRMTSSKSSVRATSRGGNQEVCVFKPTTIEDSREITETLLDGKAVIVNFEGLHVEISQRIIDFISGSCYALEGNLQKISNYIFIATPASVDISGDFQDLIGTDDASFDLSGLKSPLM